MSKKNTKETVYCKWVLVVAELFNIIVKRIDVTELVTSGS